MSIVAYLAPGLFAPYRGAIVPSLMVIMFAMGLTLRPEDLVRVATRPAPVFLGVALQFSVMPVAALVIGRALALPDELVAGLVLLGACPGGTASNVMAYLAKADVALSVSMTLLSTVLAVVATPLLTWLLIGQTVPVDMGAMLVSLVKIVVVPVAAGVLLNRFLGRVVERAKPVLPAVAALAILFVLGVIVALNRDNLASAGVAVFVAVFLHNACGLLGGYWVPRLAGFDIRTCRTLSLEVGMQNSGLGVALSVLHFTPLAALPSVLFSVWHNISGALLAGRWSARPPSGIERRQTRAG
ncbi:MAG: bile acid:sodium symporter family protein [Pseudomonadota bacterium]